MATVALLATDDDIHADKVPNIIVCPPNSPPESQKLAVHAVRSKLDVFEHGVRRTTSSGWKSLSLRTRKFYLGQNREIANLKKLELMSATSGIGEHERYQADTERHEKIATYLSGVGNFILLASLLVAFLKSGAISIVASLVDSGLDNLSVIVIIVTNWAKRNVDRSQYPQGKERLEPVGVMIFSCIMGSSSIVLIAESVRHLVTDPWGAPDAGVLALSLVAGDILMKVALYLVCRRYAAESSSAAALTQDHRNDLALNSVALVTAGVSSYSAQCAPLDPIGAILIAMWTGYSWGQTGLEQIRMLTGSVASPEFLRMLTYMCIQHDTRVLAIDTVRAFHFGTRFLVEIDLILPSDMPLLEAHGIGESLQDKVEQLNEVERAFVHLDVDSDHNPEAEHKQWGLHRVVTLS